MIYVKIVWVFFFTPRKHLREPYRWGPRVSKIMNQFLWVFSSLRYTVQKWFFMQTSLQFFVHCTICPRVLFPDHFLIFTKHLVVSVSFANSLFYFILFQQREPVTICIFTYSYFLLVPSTSYVNWCCKKHMHRDKHRYPCP